MPDLAKISKAVSKKLGKEIEFVACEPLASGYHSDGYKLTSSDGSLYFIKRVKSKDLGFVFPERQISSLLVSHEMAQRFDTAPKAVAVVVINDKEVDVLPELDDKSEIYHIQEFGGVATSYWTLLQEKKAKTVVDEADTKELEQIIKIITGIHSHKHHLEDKDQLNAVYNDSLRSIVGHPELTLMLLNEFPEGHPLLPPEKHPEYIGYMINLIRTWKDRSERLVALHGDFWGANVFFRPDGTAWIIDFSRIPWGDPGDDIAHWLSQYLWFYHETKNPYFKELGERFLALYMSATGDKELRRAVALKFGLMGIIITCPRLYPNLDFKVAEPFFNTIIKILKTGEFSWE